MSYIYHSDYTTSDYWDPILYPKFDAYSGLLYDKINKCIKKEKGNNETEYFQIPTLNKILDISRDNEYDILYCDLSDTVKKYNEFLKFYTTVFNKIVDEYNKISNSISTMNVGNPVVDDWLRWVSRLSGENIDIQKITYRPIQNDVSKLIVCDTIIEILELIRNDIDNRMTILKKISQFRTVNPTALWNIIFSS